MNWYKQALEWGSTPQKQEPNLLDMRQQRLMDSKKQHDPGAAEAIDSLINTNSPVDIEETMNVSEQLVENYKTYIAIKVQNIISGFTPGSDGTMTDPEKEAYATLINSVTEKIMAENKMTEYSELQQDQLQTYVWNDVHDCVVEILIDMGAKE